MLIHAVNFCGLSGLDFGVTKGFLELNSLWRKVFPHSISKKKPSKAPLNRPPAVIFDLLPPHVIGETFTHMVIRWLSHCVNESSNN